MPESLSCVPCEGTLNPRVQIPTGDARPSRPPTTAAVFSVFAPKSSFRSRTIVVWLSPASSDR
jgi:hypothetical protein